jgi:hypothetical protein
MRARFLAIALASVLSLFVIVPQASAHTVAPCAIGAVVPFSVPEVGVDPFGRPFALQVSGAYGPYDGFGYPLRFNTVGFYAGLPFTRLAISYVPMPCPPALAEPVVLDTRSS